MSDWKFDGANFSNWGVLPGVESKIQDGPSYKNQDGNSYTKQTGDATSLQFGNKNAFQYGISNSALIGLSFSTNVAITVSTLVGVGFSFQLAGSVSAFAGPKLSLNRSWEISASWAKKLTWVKDEDEYEVKEGSIKAVDKEAKFAKDANAWYQSQSIVAVNEVKKVLDGAMTYAKLETKVTGQCNTTAGSLTLKGAGQFMMSTLGKLSLEGATGITMESLRVQINGKIVNLC